MFETLFSFRGPFGVRVDVQASLILLVGLFLLAGGEDYVASLTFVAIIIVSIFLHEFGHAWGYIIQGLPVRRVVLNGGGGFCEGKRSVDRKALELIVFMGPAVNLVIWAGCSLISDFVISDDLFEFQLLLYRIAIVNFYLAIFNLIPAHPLDGGKLFQLFLLRIINPQTASRISGAVGFALSVIWIPAALAFYMSFGFVLFFFPSVIDHWRMARGQ